MPNDNASTTRSPNHTDRDHWIYGGIIGGLFVTVVGVGLYGYYDNHYVLGSLYTVIGLIGIGMTISFMRGYRLTLLKLAILILVSTWILFGLDLFDRFSNPITPQNSSSPDTTRNAVEAAITPLQMQIIGLKKDLASRDQQISDLSQDPSKREPIETPMPVKKYSQAETEEFRNVLHNLRETVHNDVITPTLQIKNNLDNGNGDFIWDPNKYLLGDLKLHADQLKAGWEGISHLYPQYSYYKDEIDWVLGNREVGVMENKVNTLVGGLESLASAHYIRDPQLAAMLSEVTSNVSIEADRTREWAEAVERRIDKMRDALR